MAPAERILSLRLFVAADSPDSVAAVANLKALFPSGRACEVDLEIVDVREDPARAVREGILVTPTLLKIAPAPACRVLGNLKNRDALRKLLGLDGA